MSLKYSSSCSVQIDLGVPVGVILRCKVRVSALFIYEYHCTLYNHHDHDRAGNSCSTA